MPWSDCSAASSRRTARSSPSSWCSSSSASWRCSTCRASTPTSSTTASRPATPTTSSAPAAVMLAVSLVQIVCAVIAVYFGARTAMAFGRDVRAELFHRVGSVLHPRDAAVRRAVADHAHDQRRPAGADARADGLHDDGRGADHDGRRRPHGDARGRRASAGCWPWCVPALFLAVGFVVSRMVPELPRDAGPHRRGQPGAARADHRHPGGPCVRPRAARAASGSARPTTTSPTSRCGSAAGWRRCSRWSC